MPPVVSWQLKNSKIQFFSYSFVLIGMNILIDFLYDFLALVFPDLCGACGKNLLKGENQICVSCLYKLPYTNFHLDQGNRLARQFWGRVELVQAIAFLHFRKGGRTQRLLHEIKYKNRQELGKRMGKLYGQKLAASSNFIKPDLIIPVPLHPKKLKSRGYNQSACIAEGLSIALDVPVSLVHLSRNLHTETQTRKSRFARYENMQEAFVLTDGETLRQKHILLVDDVVTTGSTLEACVLCLQQVDANISLACLAYAE